MAIHEPAAFAAYVERAKASLPAARGRSLAGQPAALNEAPSSHPFEAFRAGGSPEPPHSLAGRKRLTVPAPRRKQRARESRTLMTDLAALERDLLGQVEAAPDEAALEALRVSALGKKGAVSDLLKTLGAMTPDERKEKGPLINGLRDKVQGAIATRREALAEAALEQRLAAERIDVTPAGARGAGDARAHPPDQPGDRRDHRDLRRHGLLGRRRAGHRDRLSTTSRR